MLTEVSIAVGHILLASAACLILWKIWLLLTRRDAAAAMIIGAGLIIRSIGTQVLFWISFLNLPVARNLQEGGGFWKFSVDSELYFSLSSAMLANGWRAVVLVDRSLPSPVYLQCLSLFRLLFGVVTSVGGLLNLFAYLAGCAAVLWIGTMEGGSRRATLIALAALAFSPSLVLWSTQPLKDAFFISSVAIFVAACNEWRRAWLEERIRFANCLTALIVILASLCAVVGVRWYFGVLLWGVAIPFFAAIVSESSHRILAGLSSAALLVLMLRAVMFVSGPYFPEPLARLLTPSVRLHDISRSADDLASFVAVVRSGFDQSGAKTQIRLGSALTNLQPKRPDKPAPSITESTSNPTIASPIRTATAPVRSGAKTQIRLGSALTNLQPKRPDKPAPSITESTSNPTIASPIRTATPVRKVPALDVAPEPPVPGTPRSPFTRVLAGLVAVVVPRWVGQTLGIIVIAGGSGMWPVVEADTFFFDTVLLITLFYVGRGVKAGALRHPAFWLVALMTVGITILLTYTVANFGTLFRHRSMILMGLCLLLAVTRAASPPASAPPELEN